MPIKPDKLILDRVSDMRSAGGVSAALDGFLTKEETREQCEQSSWS